MPSSIAILGNQISGKPIGVDTSLYRGRGGISINGSMIGMICLEELRKWLARRDATNVLMSTAYSYTEVEEMTLDSLKLARNILLRTFVVGVLFALFFALVTFGCWNTWIGLATQCTHADQATLVPIILNFFVELRFFLVFLLLTPALALHWTIKAHQR